MVGRPDLNRQPPCSYYPLGKQDFSESNEADQQGALSIGATPVPTIERAFFRSGKRRFREVVSPPRARPQALVRTKKNACARDGEPHPDGLDRSANRSVLGATTWQYSIRSAPGVRRFGRL